ncbi:hypothetical protein ABZ413_29655 [Nocardia rhamnosiphila]|uniref:hypothetical protein n=1 Tax=Nocardia rhamnosiphila TaxID=426716 RepID=UPI0034114DF0
MDDEDLLEGIPGHGYSAYFEDDTDLRCECGKWLEPGYYEFLDHVKDVIRNPEYWAGHSQPR